MTNTGSLTGRVQWVVGAVVIGAVCTIGVVLDRAFVASSRMAVHERLQLNVYSLLGAADYRDGRPRLPTEVDVPGFNQIGSGLYGFVLDRRGDVLWHSQSVVGDRFAPVLGTLAGVERGRRRFDVVDSAAGKLFAAAEGVAWEADGTMADYAVVVLQVTRPFERRLWIWRRSLWGGLAAVVLTLLVVEYLALHWALRPLRGLVGDLRTIQDGRASRLGGGYPKELSPLTSLFNEVLEQEQRQRERYRNSLADLAHSIKTPLAVLRGLIRDDPDAHHRRQLGEQVARLDDIVSYQLQRAVIAGRKPLAQPVPVAPLVDKVVRSLRKVYRDKAITVDEQLATGLCFHGDERDLLEVLGNLLDNAFKYAVGTVVIRIDDERAQGRRQLRIAVDNDGAPIDADAARRIVRRGARLDSRQPGQGIGLAVVADIADSYGGSIRVLPRAGGGLSVMVAL